MIKHKYTENTVDKQFMNPREEKSVYQLRPSASVDKLIFPPSGS